MSIVDNHFPQVVWRDGDKYLWNPIQKKALKNQPEERIRLRVIEYLLKAGWSKHRISTEEGITSPKKGKLRTDLICYTQSFDPFLLVECKAPSVSLSDHTAEQIARYNSSVQAPYLLMTNSRTDFWYSFQDNQPVLKKAVPEQFRAKHQPEKQAFEYWVERGFAGKKAAPQLRAWLTKKLNEDIYASQFILQFLSFNKTLSDIDLDHYYQIVKFADSRLALAFVATGYGGSRLVAIQNKNGKNRALIEINLDLLFNHKVPNCSLYNHDGSKNIDIRTNLEWNENKFDLVLFGEKINNWLS